MNAADLEGLIPELFAPWVRQLDISVIELGDGEARFEIGENADLVRAGGIGGGVICGQALSAAADTLSVVVSITCLTPKSRYFLSFAIQTNPIVPGL